MDIKPVKVIDLCIKLVLKDKRRLASQKEMYEKYGFENQKKSAQKYHEYEQAIDYLITLRNELMEKKTK